MFRAEPGTFQPLRASDTYRQAVYRLLEIWQAWQSLIGWETDPNASEIEIETTRQILNDRYDAFLEQHGLISSNMHLFRVDGIFDSRLHLLQALETPDGKADVFTRRTHFPPQVVSGQYFFDEDLQERVSKAYAFVMNESSSVDLARIAEITGCEAEDVEEILLELGLVVRAPQIEGNGGHRRMQLTD